MILDGFEQRRVHVGGAGPPVLLLHGHPQTHVMWHRVAPLLAEHLTVVAADLLALWSLREELPRWFDVLAAWRGWAEDVRGSGVDAAHYLAEEAPGEVAAALLAFLTGPVSLPR